MKNIYYCFAQALVIAGSLLVPISVATATGDLTKQKPVEVSVQLGTSANTLKFTPANLVFETGRLYRLKLINPSSSKHYFTSESFAAAVYTRKVQVNDAQGKPLAEVKGTVREIEVYPHSTAEWWFVPIKTGTFGDLRCTIKGHAQGGMVGTIQVN